MKTLEVIEAGFLVEEPGSCFISFPPAMADTAYKMVSREKRSIIKLETRSERMVAAAICLSLIDERDIDEVLLEAEELRDCNLLPHDIEPT